MLPQQYSEFVGKNWHSKIIGKGGDDQLSLKLLLEDSGIYVGKDILSLFGRANATYPKLLNAFRNSDFAYLNMIQILWSLSDEEMSQISDAVFQRLSHENLNRYLADYNNLNLNWINFISNKSYDNSDIYKYQINWKLQNNRNIKQNSYDIQSLNNQNFNSKKGESQISTSFRNANGKITHPWLKYINDNSQIKFDPNDESFTAETKDNTHAKLYESIAWHRINSADDTYAKRTDLPLFNRMVSNHQPIWDFAGNSALNSHNLNYSKKNQEDKLCSEQKLNKNKRIYNIKENIDAETEVETKEWEEKVRNRKIEVLPTKSNQLKNKAFEYLDKQLIYLLKNS